MPARPRKSTPSGATDVSEWKKEQDPVLELPSGKRVEVMAHPNMRVFLKAGIIPNALVGIVQQAIDKGKTPDVSKLIKDDDQIDEMLDMVDRVVCFVVKKPDIQPIPPEDEDRDSSVLYVDEIEQTDKMFIFQWATGGTRDLERFHREYNAALGSIPGSNDVVGTTVKSSRD